MDRPHIILKRPQFLVASTWLETGGSAKPEPLITLQRDGHEDWTGTRADLCQHLGICMHHLWYLRRKKTPDGWSFSEWKKPLADKAARSEMKLRLEELKRIPHDPIQKEFIQKGFIDADGCLALHPSGSIILSAHQKYSAITDALKRKFGGYTSGTTDSHCQLR